MFTMLKAKLLKIFLKAGLLFTTLLLIYNYYNGVDTMVEKIWQRRFKDDSLSSDIRSRDNINIKRVHCDWMTIDNHTNHLDAEYGDCQLPWYMNENCKESKQAYGSIPTSKSCPKEKGIVYADICSVTSASFRRSDDSSIEIMCNIDACKGSAVRIGLFQSSSGRFPRKEDWMVAKSKKDLDRAIRAAISRTAKEGVDFCLLTCNPGDKTVRQALILPPFIQTNEKSDLDLFNVNIVVLDSVSREHFYRQLPSTVEKMKSINFVGETKVYDFELLQSIAPRTFPNIRALFSGNIQVDIDDTDLSYNMSVLLNHLHSMGYQSLIQEDSCWIDSWGSLFTDNKHSLNNSVKSITDRWLYIQERLDKDGIDSIGLTHFTCEVLKQYGLTNQFNDPPKVCFNGVYLSSYFLNYLHTHLIKTQSTLNAKPLFSYTHLNIGHEKTGKRIAYFDEEFARNINKWSKLKNTLTIILSDHGPKTTKYSQDTVGGRFEISHALMFMVVPQGVAESLSTNGMKALSINQKRYISTLDLHKSLMSIGDKYYSGLFHKSYSGNRRCGDVPIYAFAQCICGGHMELLPNMDPSTHWLAEFALGKLNNLLQSKFQKSQNFAVIGGYGNCERLIGESFTKIKLRRTPITKEYLFDIVVNRYRSTELFEVAISVKKNSTREYPRLIKWRRVTIFQHFSKCLDNGVPIDLCICRKESYGVVNPARDITKLISQSIFGVKNDIEFINSKCLVILSRYLKNTAKTFELTNMCTDRYYSVTFTLKLDTKSNIKYRTSTKLPLKLLVLPWTLYYVTTVYNEAQDWSSNTVKPNVVFEAVTIKS